MNWMDAAAFLATSIDRCRHANNAKLMPQVAPTDIREVAVRMSAEGRAVARRKSLVEAGLRMNGPRLSQAPGMPTPMPVRGSGAAGRQQRWCDLEAHDRLGDRELARPVVRKFGQMVR
ncbi:MAG: hypothetical protein ABJD97_06565, partial [Betaproteobacteria bacterium]